MIYLFSVIAILYGSVFYSGNIINIMGLIVIFQVVLLMPPLSYWYETFVARKITKREEDKLKPVLKKVLAKADLNIKPRLLVSDSYDPNMTAFNKDTVIVNKVCLKSFTDDELAGILCHEIGHLKYKHSGSVLVHYINSLAVTFTIRSTYAVLQVLIEGVQRSFILMLLIFPVLLAFGLAIFLPLWAMSWFISIFSSNLWRSREYEADDFAKENGFGVGLIGGLEKLSAYEDEPEGAMEKLLQTHPPIAHRIERLE